MCTQSKEKGQGVTERSRGVASRVCEQLRTPSACEQGPRGNTALPWEARQGDNAIFPPNQYLLSVSSNSNLEEMIPARGNEGVDREEDAC